MFRVVLLNTLALALAGCATVEANSKMFERQRPVTDLERMAILEHIRNSFFDPYSIRDAEISNAVPTVELATSATKLRVCVKANAKNRMGGYAGRKTTMFFLDTSGRVADVASEGDDTNWRFLALTCESSQLHYSLFSEAEHIAEKR